MATNRYVGEYPVIGIRPVIDARRGPLYGSCCRKAYFRKSTLFKR